MEELCSKRLPEMAETVYEKRINYHNYICEIIEKLIIVIAKGWKVKKSNGIL